MTEHNFRKHYQSPNKSELAEEPDTFEAQQRCRLQRLPGLITLSNVIGIFVLFHSKAIGLDDRTGCPKFIIAERVFIDNNSPEPSLPLKSITVATNRERISTGLDLLTEGLAPYVEEKLRKIHRDNWIRSVESSFRDDRSRLTQDGKSIDWDAHSLLTVMWDQWNSVFRHDLGHYERSLVSELREFRNRWAHQQAFTFDDVFRVLDSCHRLLKSVDAKNVVVIEREKTDLLESHVAEKVNSQVQKTAFQRNKWWVIGIYALCCCLIIIHAIMFSNEGSITLISFVLLIFIYLIYQQFKMEAPLLYGPRECPRCHRIVYRKPCPYCQLGANE
ncbi:Swt1 family HEPN domain-containing protein [Thalassoglobus neptunius]|uniref:Swt1 family HEPN domain-containing protein n=1 Tax=Thalassoglobus neptunius TaxID=1938619 RepID=UPI0011B3B03F|nr:Swt1 family HEPN domain-containing protein [Thalassoglobus neptunius]